MKTLDEIYSEVLGDKKLTAEFMALKSADEKTAFVKKLGGEATSQEIADFLKKSSKNGELTDAELEQVVGGKISIDKCPSCGSGNCTLLTNSDNVYYGQCYDCGYIWYPEDKTIQF